MDGEGLNGIRNNNWSHFPGIYGFAFLNFSSLSSMRDVSWNLTLAITSFWDKLDSIPFDKNLAIHHLSIPMGIILCL